MGQYLSRRSFLRLTGALGVGTVGLGTQVRSVEALDDRYVVDTSTGGNVWRSNVEVVHDLPEIDIAVVRGSEEALGSVEYSRDFSMEIEPPVTASEHTALGDAESALQWDKRAQNTFELHEAGYTGEGSKIAIIDSGVDPDHPDLEANINEAESGNLTEEDGDYSDTLGHGTHVAGIAAAADNGEGVVGVAPDAEIVALRVSETNSGIKFGNVVAGVYRAASIGCDALNLSLAFYPLPSGLDTQIMQESIDRAVRFSHDAGCLTVVAAGNADVNLDNDGPILSLPLEAAGTLRVSATGPSGFGPERPLSDTALPTHTPSFYTNYGADALTVSAAGGNITAPFPDNYLDLVYSTVPGGYSWKGGTSMAAPQVTGLVALVKSENPNASPARIKNHIARTADHIRSPDYTAAEYFAPDEEVDGWGFANGILEDVYHSETYRGNGHVDVEGATTEPIPFPQPLEVDGYTIAPHDPDGDGRFEDVNGDGEVDMDDVHALFELFMSGAPLSDAEEAALDFDGDGDFDQFDVQELLDQVRT